MMSITENEHNIKDIYIVLQCSHRVGKITVNLKGRHSDCFVYVISGKTEYTFTDNTHLSVQANDVLYLAKGSKYIMNITEEPYEVIYVDFDFDTALTNTSGVFHIKNFTDMKNIFYRMNRKWINKNHAYRLECLSHLYRIYALTVQNEHTPYSPQSVQIILKNSIKEIADNFSNPELSVSELARLSGVSEGHFRRIFKNVFSVSPMQYILSVRIEHAKELLTHETVTISQIAEMSGFTSSYYFCKKFKSKTGVSPTNYRKEHKNV